MLIHLRVENIAIIESLAIEFGSGLNLLTGETGAGKSIIVDSVGLLLGARATPEIIRAGAEIASVEAEFMVSQTESHLHELLEKHDIELEEGSRILLRRDVGEKRSRAYVQGRSVPLATLRDFAAGLVTIHGQNEHQALFDASSHLQLLDLFGRNENVAADVSAFARTGRLAQEALARIELRMGEVAKRRDYLEFLVQDIRGAGLTAGEEESLRNEKYRLLNAEKIRTLATAATEGLYEAEGSAVERLAAARKCVDELARIDLTLAPIFTQLGEVADTLQEISRMLADVAAAAEADPARLDAIEERLYAIEKLKKKYGPDIPAILMALEESEAELQTISRLHIDAREAQDHLKEARAAYQKAADELSGKRHEAAEKLSRSLRKQLGELAMPSVQFEVRFLAVVDNRFDESGNESAEFYISPNPGEPIRPLALIASGGELSRIMLALRNAASDGGTDRTLIFDEIDAGIGGPTAEVVGRKLYSVARKQQVLCVTHLPQIAAFGEHHLAVAKTVQSGRTVARVIKLDAEGRIQEIARMMGSAEPSSTALRHAREILDKASNRQE